MSDSDKLERDRALKRKWKEANLEKYKTQQKNWYKNNRKRVLVSSKNAKIKRIFGLSPDEYYAKMDSLWEKQKGKCAICGLTGTSCGKNSVVDKSTLQLDHDHASNDIRGLLCPVCNRVLGFFKDNPVRFMEAAKYILTYRK